MWAETMQESTALIDQWGLPSAIIDGLSGEHLKYAPVIFNQLNIDTFNWFAGLQFSLLCIKAATFLYALN